MAILQIPYSFKNGQSVGDCGIEYLVIDTANNNLCGEMYSTLRIVDLPIIDGVQGVTFSYNSDTYTVTTLSIDETILLLQTAFTCPNGYCNGQLASFDYELVPLSGEEWVSETIVNNVSATNVVYSFSDITINGTTYNPLPYQFWDDSSDGNASQNTFDYNQAIIDYLVSLNIPEYRGAINYGVNGVADNSAGTGLLSLIFATGTTVSIDITAPSPVISGTFVENTDSGGSSILTYMLLLTLTDDSVMAQGDLLETTNWIVSDGNNITGNTTTPVATIIVYNLFCGECALDPSQSFVITEVIVTQNICARSNVAVGYILSDDIQDAIINQTSKFGSSVN